MGLPRIELALVLLEYFNGLKVGYLGNQKARDSPICLQVQL
jgi:hypothetical protein